MGKTVKENIAGSNDADLQRAAPEMLAKLKKLATWLYRLEGNAERLSKDTRFPALAAANAADARNYRSTRLDIQAVIDKAEGK